MDQPVAGSDAWKVGGKRLTRAQQRTLGRRARAKLPDGVVAELTDRNASVALQILAADDGRRIASLLPLRYGRMAVDPFAFLRGAAAVMAHDLSRGPTSGVEVQLCGDAHLANFGVYTAPEGRLVFDVDDFDETARGPFEWDLKRLVASVWVAAATNGIGNKAARRLVVSTVRSYRAAIAEDAGVDPLTIWRQRFTSDQLFADLRREAATKRGRKGIDDLLHKAVVQPQPASPEGALAKHTVLRGAAHRFISAPPLVTRLTGAQGAGGTRFASFFERYAATLWPDRRQLFERYRLADVARKVVGVGSVGTRCYVALFETGDHEAIFLQVKEAGPSVLERDIVARPGSHAQRVVEGQRAIQAAPDAMLGWATLDDDDGPVDCYVRHLWDGKVTPSTALMDERQIETYARMCATILAHAHARTGSAAMIDGFIGEGAVAARFDEAVTEFAHRYAKRTKEDFDALTEAIHSGTITAADG